MSTDIFEQFNRQVEKLVAGPARASADVGIEYAEGLARTQIETARACAEASLEEARAALDVRRTEDLQTYFEGRQKRAEELGERLREDAGKVASLNRELVGRLQRLTEDSAENAASAARTG